VRTGFFWYTSTSWDDVETSRLGGLLAGRDYHVLRTEAPPTPTRAPLWEGRRPGLGTTTLGTSPGYVLANIKAGGGAERSI